MKRPEHLHPAEVGLWAILAVLGIVLGVSLGLVFTKMVLM